MTNVSHIGGTGTVGDMPHVFCPHHSGGVWLKPGIHLPVLFQGQVTRNGLDVDLGANGHRSSPEGTVHFLVGVHYGLDGLAPHKGLHSDVGRNCADGLAALGNDRMDPDSIFVAECLPIVMYGAEGQRSRVEGVDSQVGRAAGMGALSNKLNFFGQRAVVGAADAQLSFFGIASGVNHHCQVNVVEFTNAYHLRFTAQKLQLAVAP